MALASLHSPWQQRTKTSKQPCYHSSFAVCTWARQNLVGVIEKYWLALICLNWSLGPYRNVFHWNRRSAYCSEGNANGVQRRRGRGAHCSQGTAATNLNRPVPNIDGLMEVPCPRVWTCSNKIKWNKQPSRKATKRFVFKHAFIHSYRTGSGCRVFTLSFKCVSTIQTWYGHIEPWKGRFRFWYFKDIPPMDAYHVIERYVKTNVKFPTGSASASGRECDCCTRASTAVGNAQHQRIEPGGSQVGQVPPWKQGNLTAKTITIAMTPIARGEKTL